MKPTVNNKVLNLTNYERVFRGENEESKVEDARSPSVTDEQGPTSQSKIFFYVAVFMF